MIVLKTFLCCMSLRLGCVLLGYFIILHGFANVYLVVLEYGQICHRMIMIWILHAQINIIAGILLLTVAYNPQTLNYLLPVQIVVKLTSLIIELIFYLLMSSASIEDELLVAYSFLSIGTTIYVVIVVYSFYQETDNSF
ncbi:uncharacterized protein LOC115763139 isoform X1 [Drosophila novamexicana]|uniref:uncharacterized protein LOC115763139 isoform X1 n=1 Tax=Drosophila novamexicana TaxID=47314 RepID=UPI0011E5A22A|nr:uncharacterized protein LOC115763139 isoform X1 [Drosophila novamexicana]